MHDNTHVSTIAALAEACEKSNNYFNDEQCLEEALNMCKEDNSTIENSSSSSEKNHESVIKICRCLGECYESNNDCYVTINYYNELTLSFKETPYSI